MPHMVEEYKFYPPLNIYSEMRNLTKYICRSFQWAH